MDSERISAPSQALTQAVAINTLQKSMVKDASNAMSLINNFKETNAKTMEQSVTGKGKFIDASV